jgi:hypothetical protein
MVINSTGWKGNMEFWDGNPSESMKIYPAGLSAVYATFETLIPPIQNDDSRH